MVTATVVGGVIVAIVALGSSLTLPPLITSLPTAEPVAPPTAEPTPPPTSEATDVEPTALAAPGAGSGSLLQALITAVAIVLAVLLVIVVFRVVRNLAASTGPAPIDEVVDEPEIDAQDVNEVMHAARERIDVDDDPNRVVVECWEALEAIAAGAGVVRAEAETAGEYVVDMLARLDLPADAARRLSALYAAPLFSPERLSEQAVSDARDCLDRLTAALRDRAERA